MLAGQEAPWTTPTAAQIEAIYPAIEALYIDLHKNPELAFQETQTAAKLAAHVKALGFEVTTGVGGTGVVAVMKNGSGPTVMLRTELDALPVEEKTGLPYASTVKVKNASGQLVPVMHACGHDLHMAAWAGAARLMAENRNRWQGTLVMVGQPAEEGGAGAPAMLKDGLFTRFPRPDFALSLHDDDTMPAGTIGYHPGLFRAMSDNVTITMFGRGGHAAMPHSTIDPVVLSAKVILSLQTLCLARAIPCSPSSSPSVRFTEVHDPTSSLMRSRFSCRCGPSHPKCAHVPSRPSAASSSTKRKLPERPREPRIDVQPSTRYAVNNDPKLTLRLADVLKKHMGEQNVIEMPAKMTSEDFSEYGVAGVPSALLHIGAVSPAKLAAARESWYPGARTALARVGAGSGGDAEGRHSR